MRTHYDSDLAIRLLGAPAASHLPVIAEVLRDLPAFEYPWTSQEQFGHLLKQDWRRAMKVYWLEILYRAHFAAVTSLLRTSRWLEAILTHGALPNYAAFTAAYRGYLEAAADSFHSLQHVPAILLELREVIRDAVLGRAAQPSLCKEIEDDLIHFTHARHVKQGEAVDDTHRARQTREYLDGLAADGLHEVHDCYRELCDVTHPGIGSVRCYIDNSVPPSDRKLRVLSTLDGAWIEDFCRRYEKVSERSMFFGIVPPMLIMRALNDFPVDAVRTPSVMTVGVDEHPAWATLRDGLPRMEKRPYSDC